MANTFKTHPDRKPLQDLYTQALTTSKHRELFENITDEEVKKT